MIANQGSSFSFPQQSLPGFADAFYSGADFLLCTIWLTQDGFIVLNTDSKLDETTNIAENQEFNATQGNHYIHDYTLEQIKTLRLKQSNERRSKSLNNIFQMAKL